MSQILTFPRSLRSSADDKMPHIGFSLTGKHKPPTTEIERIHMYTPSGISTKDGASFSGMDMGAINAGKEVTSRMADGETLADVMADGKDGMVMAMKGIGGLFQALKQQRQQEQWNLGLYLIHKPHWHLMG